MHKDIDINIKNISKIEGHTHLVVKVRNRKVQKVKLKISENKRFYTQAIRGMDFNMVPHRVSRICGTCSVAHQICSIEAIEKALGVKPSRQSVLLRKLIMNGSMIRDHALHLYFFCLPDLFGKESILDFTKSQHRLIHDAFKVKSAGTELCNLVGGRSVHPMYMRVGGFSRVPERDRVKPVIKGLEEAREKVLELIKLFYDCSYRFRRKTNYVALVTNDYGFLEGEIRNSSGLCIPESQYFDHLYRVIIPYSTSTGFEFGGQEFMVGALSRMNLNKKSLNKDTKKSVHEALDIFPTDCVYQNNLAQAIEILHCIDQSLDMLENQKFRKETTPRIRPRRSHGVGVIEAPRGTLYYHISLNKKGVVDDSNIVIPTAQNSINIERDIKELVGSLLGMPKKRIELEIEKLIRAYDPCMSCATHFLKVRWV